MRVVLLAVLLVQCLIGETSIASEHLQALFEMNEIPLFVLRPDGSIEIIDITRSDEDSDSDTTYPLPGYIWTQNNWAVSMTQTGAYSIERNRRVIFTCEPGDAFCPLFLSENEDALFAVTDYKSKTELLVAIDLSGNMTPLHWDQEMRRDVGGLVLWGDSCRDLAAIYYFDSTIHYTFFSASLANAHIQAQSLFPDADIIWVNGDANGERWLCRVMQASQPECWLLFSDNGHKYQFLFKSRNLPNTIPAHNMEYITRDGSRATGVITVPDGAGPFSLIVFIHGGPSTKVNHWFDPRVQALVQEGYAVFQPNYRGSRGLGKRWRLDGWKQWGNGTAQYDITDGVQHLIKSGVADKSKIAVFGGSFGGYMAMSAIAFTPEIYRCGISFFGISDLAAYVEGNNDILRDFDKPMYGDRDNADELQYLRSQSPLHAELGIQRSLFLYHGVKDTLVPVWHSDAIASYAIRSGACVEYHREPMGNHGFGDTESEVAIFDAMLRFLKRELSNFD